MSWCLSGRALVKQPRMDRRCSWVHRDPPFRQDPKTKDRTGQMTANGPAWHKQSGEWLLPRDWLKLGKSHWLDTCEWVHSSEHNIISCASKSRAKNVKEVLIPQKLITSSRRKTWQPKEVTSAQEKTVVIAHQAYDQGWKITPKCHRNTQEEFHQAYPAFCPTSDDSEHLPGNKSPSLITPFQASALTSIFMATANEFLSSAPWWQQTWKENESALPHPGVPHPCPPTYGPNNTHSLPSGWGRRSGLCSPRDRADIPQ